MEQRTGIPIFENSAFRRIALATGVLLLVPLIAMQITDKVDWGSIDFIVMGSLLFGLFSLFEFSARKLPTKRRLIICGMFFVVFLFIWAELAVGVFTNLGS